MRIQVGCGNDKRQGYVNIDSSKEVNPDVVWNLEKTPLPFKDNEINFVLANHVMEHIENFIPLMHDLHRVCKPNSIIKIRTPFYSSWGQFNDPTHRRFFTLFTFEYFKKNNYSHEVSCNKDMFFPKKIKINYGIGKLKKLNWIVNPLLNLNHNFYCRFFAWIFPASEIEYVLEVIK